MSDIDREEGGLRGRPRGAEFTDLFGEHRRPVPPSVESDPGVSDALIRDDKEALYAALERAKQARRGR